MFHHPVRLPLLAATAALALLAPVMAGEAIDTPAKLRTALENALKNGGTVTLTQDLDLGN